MRTSDAGAEAARQASLDAMGLVDTLPEPAYDAVVQLATIICEVPIALVSLIDRDRQWFKARVGLETSQTPRSMAFCDHAIRTPGALMEVEDALQDPRFSDNPLVVGDPNIRFYAGRPLVDAHGHALGTVCVIDRRRAVVLGGDRGHADGRAAATAGPCRGRGLISPRSSA